MPRYYFNVFNDVSVIDEEGVELAGEAEARQQARQAAADMVAEQIAGGSRLDPTLRIEVQDEDRRIVHTLWFGELVEPDPAP